MKSIRQEQNFQVNVDLAQEFFSRVKTGSVLVCRPCDCTSGNLNNTRVIEMCRGVYLAIAVP